ncbi:MAG TPA: GGDEF domain-containing protein [Candidatus Cottocaccamicrobium excrementipullorum]|nr:GGDEF domain-containing protein [Candidatus Cottocaccamicrobium excrementipullorum]
MDQYNGTGRRGKDKIYSLMEIKQIVELFSPFFDSVRLVDPVNCRAVCLEDQRVNCEEKCYEFWKKNRQCADCTSLQAIEQGKRVSKFEMMDRKLFYVISAPIKVQDSIEQKVHLWVLELAVENYGRFSSAILKGGPLIENIIACEHELYEDSLTKAYNRRYFDERLFYIGDGNPQEMVFIAADLKHFKRINDTYGHAVGDYVLAQAVRLMKRTVRSDDAIIRMGGDEFLIVLNNCNRDAAARIIEDIRDEFKHELVYDREKGFYATVNFGISYRDEFDGSDSAVRQMYEEADRNMYLDKQSSEG